MNIVHASTYKVRYLNIARKIRTGPPPLILDAIVSRSRIIEGCCDGLGHNLLRFDLVGYISLYTILLNC